MAYLSVHFKEKITIDGEQVYFAVSKDGYNWKQVNNGCPMITCTKGEMGCRDIEIVRLEDNSFVILATDLCVVNRMDENYNIDWKDINHNGSKFLNMWRTDDLVNFTQQEQIYFGCDDLGCLWAPEVFFDEINKEYIIHWGSTNKEDDYSHMKIYYTKTKDFKDFTYPQVFFEKDNEILDSHLRKIGDTYHLFYKDTNGENSMNLHATSKNLYGPYENDESFVEIMKQLYRPGSHEAPTTFIMPDNQWCMMIDFFGCAKEEMGYVPFLSPQPGNSDFVRCPEKFNFPYGFKHGGVIEITDEEYDRLINL